MVPLYSGSGYDCGVQGGGGDDGSVERCREKEAVALRTIMAAVLTALQEAAATFTAAADARAILTAEMEPTTATTILKIAEKATDGALEGTGNYSHGGSGSNSDYEDGGDFHIHRGIEDDNGLESDDGDDNNLDGLESYGGGFTEVLEATEAARNP